ncbi:MAG: cobalt-precorrin-5B (C(1))-methyltransferase [Firmicutes bacterium]|nr:cobalt-precorrin-5B (C(1))-methyltransferase [Bacillota bacterium]
MPKTVSKGRQSFFVFREGELVREGFSTGTCAAAVATAGVQMLITGQPLAAVSVFLPQGQEAVFTLEQADFIPEGVRCCVLKDGGDDPDVTHETPICALVRWAEGPERVRIRGGQGVGRVTKAGLKVPVGEAAINPVPRQMIRENVQRILPAGKSVEITISAPYGEELAKKTLNPKLGIVGGISILGTTGRVRPMSNEAFKESLIPQLSVARAAGFKSICLVPGGSGERAVRKLFNVPEDAICQMSNWLGFMLSQAVDLGFEAVIVAGHIGKIIKVAGGIFDTHSKVADARLEIMAAYAGAVGATPEVIREILSQGTTEAALEIVKQNGLEALYAPLAQQAAKRAEGYVQGALKVGIVFFDLSGNLIALDQNANEIGRWSGWWGS